MTSTRSSHHAPFAHFRRRDVPGEGIGITAWLASRPQSSTSPCDAATMPAMMPASTSPEPAVAKDASPGGLAGRPSLRRRRRSRGPSQRRAYYRNRPPKRYAAPPLDAQPTMSQDGLVLNEPAEFAIMRRHDQRRLSAVQFGRSVDTVDADAREAIQSVGIEHQGHIGLEQTGDDLHATGCSSHSRPAQHAVVLMGHLADNRTGAAPNDPRESREYRSPERSVGPS